MKHFFVTGIGTDVGKTYVLSCILRAAKSIKPLKAFKPIISGFSLDNASSDSHLLLDAMGLSQTQEALEQMSPYRFKAPLSPDMASRLEGTPICYENLIGVCKNKMRDTENQWFIEGVGGVMVPLDSCHTSLDWMARLQMPVILVAASYLGALNHTLCALVALKSKRIPVAAVVVSQSAHCVGLLATVSSLESFEKEIPIIPWSRHSLMPPDPLLEIIV